MGTQLPLPQRGTAPLIFGPYPLRPNGCIDQDALDVEVGLGPGAFVLDEDPAPLPKNGAQPPDFRRMFIVAKRLDGSR